MQAQFQTAAAVTSQTSQVDHNQKSVLLRILDWLAHRDSDYRQALKLRGMPGDRLADMGLSRRQANNAFYRKHANKTAERELIMLQRG